MNYLEKLYSKCLSVFIFLLACFQFSFAQEESSPLLKEKEKESGKKKIKTCTETYFVYGQNGVLAQKGIKLSVETFNQAGNIIQSFLYASNGDVTEGSQYHYDAAQKLMVEKKQAANLLVQKHVYHYNTNGKLDYGEVYVDTSLVHTCFYFYDSNNRLMKILTRHRIAFEKNVPAEEAVIYQYDEKGNVIKESDYEAELSGMDIKNKRIISSIEYAYDKDSFVIGQIQKGEKDCLNKTEFKYDGGGKITAEVHYAGCSTKPDHAVKYFYEYY